MMPQTFENVTFKAISMQNALRYINKNFRAPLSLGSVADEVLALQNKLGWYDSIGTRLAIYKSKWSEIKELLKSAPTYSEMIDLLAEVGLSYTDGFEAFYGREKIDDAYLYAKDLKDRYTVLWMYSDIFGI